MKTLLFLCLTLVAAVIWVWYSSEEVLVHWEYHVCHKSKSPLCTDHSGEGSYLANDNHERFLATWALCFGRPYMIDLPDVAGSPSSPILTDLCERLKLFSKVCLKNSRECSEHLPPEIDDQLTFDLKMRKVTHNRLFIFRDCDGDPDYGKRMRFFSAR